MKHLILSIMAAATISQVCAQTETGLPENPDPNKCYVRCVTPDVYETQEVTVQTAPEYKVLKTVPAEYKWVEEEVLVKEASEKYVYYPAEYETVQIDYVKKEGATDLSIVPASFGSDVEKVMVTPSISRWEYQSYEGCESENPLDCQVLCFREYPEEYQTVSVKTLSSNASTTSDPIAKQNSTYSKKVIKTPARTEKIDIPAEFKTIKKQVLVKDESTTEETVPAQFATVTKEVLVSKGGLTVWEEIECELLEYSILPINYELGSARLTYEAKQIIDKRLVTMMKDKPGIKIEISSHTDSRGGEAANQDLSERRAQSVVNYLMTKGINSSRLVSKGYGEARLKNRCADGVTCTEKEHSVNRRTEFRILNY